MAFAVMIVLPLFPREAGGPPVGHLIPRKKGGGRQTEFGVLRVIAFDL